MNICDYATVESVRTLADATSNADDAQYLLFIQQVSREIELISRRLFYPYIGTRNYDTPEDDTLIIPDDLVSITTLKNGDGSTISSDDYKLYPLNKSPKYKIVHTGTIGWLLNSLGQRYGAIELAGVFGYVEDYANGFESTGATLSAAISSSTATSCTCTTGKVKAGDLLQIESEWIYVSAVTVSTADTLTITRGVNGSTAVAHNISTAISRWKVPPTIQSLCRRAVIAYNKLRSNPLGETIVSDGITYTTPRDVTKYLRSQLLELGFCGRGLI
ncbi:MAG: hypothetical protein C0391_03905 [Anaerolinea sp.]|nr:hypothetical protein [Anaerolinea sp.]